MWPWRGAAADANLSIALPEAARRRGWRATCDAIVWTATPAALTAVGRAGTVSRIACEEVSDVPLAVVRARREPCPAGRDGGHAGRGRQPARAQFLSVGAALRRLDSGLRR